MKKVFVLALAFAGLTSAVKAQKGSILVGGNFDYSHEGGNQGTQKTDNFTISPTVGYQFSSHLTAGLTADINNQNPAVTGIAGDVYSSFDLGPFIRYSQPLSSIFSFYGQLQGTFGGYKYKDGSTTDAQGNTVNVQLFPAIFVNLKNNFGLNFNVGGITYGSNAVKNGPTLNSFDINFGKTLSIGLSKNFGGKK